MVAVSSDEFFRIEYAHNFQFFSDKGYFCLIALGEYKDINN